VSVYGLPPIDWYAAGIRMLGRTAVECTRDALAATIAGDVAAVVGAETSTRKALVFDPFAGSANTLFWILRRLPRGTRGLGFERDDVIFQLTSRDLIALSSSIDLVHTDYATGIGGVAPATDELMIVFVAPPWGDAFDPTSGLDLRRTNPPIAEVADSLIYRFPQNRLLLAIQLYERTDATSLAELGARFDWSASKIYELTDAGNHGILLGTKGWVPHGPPPICGVAPALDGPHRPTRRRAGPHGPARRNHRSSADVSSRHDWG
jgi:hypothetical protein